MSEPPKIDYCDPHLAVKPKPTTFQRIVGCLGFLTYGLLALAFDGSMIAIYLSRSGPPHWVLAIFALIGGFCTWRAIAGFIQFMR